MRWPTPERYHLGEPIFYPTTPRTRYDARVHRTNINLPLLDLYPPPLTNAVTSYIHHRNHHRIQFLCTARVWFLNEAIYRPTLTHANANVLQEKGAGRDCIKTLYGGSVEESRDSCICCGLHVQWAGGLLGVVTETHLNFGISVLSHADSHL